MRVAIVGMGLQGQRLAKAVGVSKHTVLAATASERKKGSFEAVLKDKTIDAVIVASPNDKHAAQAIAAAKAGKHVLCEKPMALTLSEARAMARAAQKSRVCLCVNFHLRMHPEVAEARKLLAKKKLGELLYIEACWAIGAMGATKLPPLPPHMRWRESKKAHGGTITARSVHLFDLVRYLTGKEAVRAYGWSDATRTKVEQTATTTLVLEGGVPAVITTSKLLPQADNRMTLYGSKGSITLRQTFKDSPDAMYASVMDELARMVAGKSGNLAQAQDGLATVAITDALLASHN